MITTINLRGPLGKRFGKQWKLDVETPGEAFRAIETLRPGFLQAILDMDKIVLGIKIKVGERYIKKDAVKEGLWLYNKGKTVNVTPVVRGAGGKGMSWGQIILGVVLIVAGVVIGVATSWTGVGAMFGVGLVLMGVGMIAGGVASLLQGSPVAPSEQKGGKNRASYQFGSAVNTVEQGAAIPILYGEMFTGSAVISAGIDSADIVAHGSSTTGDSNVGAGNAARVLANERNPK